MLFACWILDRAPESTRPRTLLVLSMVVTFVAMFVDLFAVQFIPGMILFGVLSALDGSRKIWPRVPQLAAVLAGILLGIVALRLLRAAANAQTGRGNLDLSLVTTHWPLLIEQCLPWLVGARLFVIDPTGNLVAAPFPPWFLPLQIAGALVFAGALISGAALFFVQRIPWRVRVLGAVGSGVAFTSLCGFLGSAAAVDIMAARLLLPVVLTLPFTLAPLAWLAGKRLPLVLLPWLLSAAIAGWLSYGAMVDGLVPRRTVRGAMTDERAVGDFLRHRGIRYAAADYWIAYRLTFILEENPIVVPEASEDRYPRWRTEFDAAPLVAYLVHQSGEDLTSEMVEARLAGKPFEKVSVQGFTVIIVDQAPAK